MRNLHSLQSQEFTREIILKERAMSDERFAGIFETMKSTCMYRDKLRRMNAASI